MRTRVVHCVVDDEGESTVTIEDNCPAPKPPSREVCDIECTWYIGEWSSVSSVDMSLSQPTIKSLHTHLQLKS